MSDRAFVMVASALMAGLVTVLLCVKPASTLPSGFRNEVVTNVSAPTALAFMPDSDTYW